MAMLGLILRTVLGKDPGQFKALFERQYTCANLGGRESHLQHSKQLKSHRQGNFLDVIANSALGLVDVFNLLPEYVVDAHEVHDCQKRLQEMLKVVAQDGMQQ